MSFMLTTDQVKARTKTVTRRLGWDFLKAGEELNAAEKCQGLKKGERIVRLARIEVQTTWWEPLNVITQPECAAEGFPDMTPAEFVAFFCRANGCEPETAVNRIQFDYLD